MMWGEKNGYQKATFFILFDTIYTKFSEKKLYFLGEKLFFKEEGEEKLFFDK